MKSTARCHPISPLHLPYVLLMSPLQVRLEDDKGEMPLHKLSRQGSMASVRALVERSAKVDALNIPNPNPSPSPNPNPNPNPNVDPNLNPDPNR